MARGECTILTADGRYLAACDDGESVNIADVGELESVQAQGLKPLAETLRQMHAGGGVMLALPTSFFYWASISTADMPKRPSPRALLFRLEEQIPADAEQLSGAFVTHNDQALGLAVVTADVRAVVEDLRKEGIDVDAVAPRTWLALQAVVDDLSVAAAGDERPAAALLAADGQAEFWTFSSQRQENAHGPTSGQFFDVTSEECMRAVKASLLLGDANSGTLLLDANLPEEIREAVKAAWPGSVNELPLHLNTLAARAGRAHLDGSRPAWANCLQGALAPQRLLRRMHRPILAAGILLGALLFAALASLLIRAYRYDHAADLAILQQEQVFAALHPGQRIPLSVRRRLEGEWKTTAALRGLSSDIPKPPSALETLYEIVRLLPGNLRLRVTEIRVEPDTVFLEGQARSHADAEATAAALRKPGTLDFAAPRTETLANGGVSFVLTGKPAEVKSAAQEAKP